MPFGIPADQIVDAEVVTDAPRPYSNASVTPVDYSGMQSLDSSGLSAPTATDLARVEKRARAIAVFVEIPFLACVSFSGRVPTWLRLGAAALALLKTTQLARESGYDYLPPEG